MLNCTLDLYTDYLLSSTGPTTATGLSRLLEGALSLIHRTHCLSRASCGSAQVWRPAKPLIRQAEAQRGAADFAVLLVDDSGTAARAACPLARRYEPACPCRFPTKGTAPNPVPQGRGGAAILRAALGAAYPNPADASVRVPYTLPAGHGLGYLELRNALGQLVRRVALPDRAGEGLFAVGNLPTGLYHCALVSNGQTLATRRLAVTH